MKPARYIASFGIAAAVVYFMMMGSCECTKKEHLDDHTRSPDRYKSVTMTALTGKNNIIPIAIIGSGPAGLSAGIYAARSKNQTVIFEGHLPGGLLMETTIVDNWPGKPPTEGPVIIEDLRIQAERAGVLFLPDTIAKVDFSVWPYKLTTEEGMAFYALSVVIATGATPRKLGVPGELKYWGHGVTACAVCDAPFFKGEDVVIVGGGDSAIEQATQLAPYARSITILVRKNRMRAAQSMQERIQSYDHISLKYHVEIREICGDAQGVTGVTLYNSQKEAEEFLPVTGVFLAIGHDPNSELFKDALERDFAGYIRTMSKTQETSVAGVFAAGEVEDNHYRQAGVASGRGIMAALDAVAFLRDIGYDLKVADKLKSQFVAQELFDRAKSVPEVSEITDYAAFERIKASNPDSLIIIDFFAEYCSSCMAMLPIYAQVAHEFKDRALFFKIDAGSHIELAQKEFLVTKVPCLLVFKGDQLVARYVNPMNKQELTDFVEKYLNETAAVAPAAAAAKKAL